MFYKLIAFILLFFSITTHAANTTDYAYITDGVNMGVLNLTQQTLQGYVKPLSNSLWTPMQINVTPDTNLAFVTNPNSTNQTTNIGIVDTKLQQEVSTMIGWDQNMQPSAVSVTPDGKYVYVGLQYANKIAIFDLNSHKILNYVKNSNGTDNFFGVIKKIVFSHDGKKAVIISRYKGLGVYFAAILDTATNTVVYTYNINELRSPSDVLISPDNKTAYFADMMTSTPIKIVDLSNYTVIQKIPFRTDGSGSPHLAATPDLQIIYFVTTNHLYIFNAATNIVTSYDITNANGVTPQIGMNSTGTKAYLASRLSASSCNIEVVDVQTSQMSNFVINGLSNVQDIHVFSLDSYVKRGQVSN